MRYLSLGGSHDIGASCHYLQIDDVGIVLDAGVDPEQEGRASLPDLKAIRHRGDRPVDHILISHAHHDHLGSLPLLAADHPQARIHMTPPTRHLAELLLPSSARLQRRKMMEGSSTAPPLFDVDMAEAVAYLFEEQDLEERFPMPSPRGGMLHGAFYHAGHTLGSAGILVEARRNGRPFRVFYTSDVHTEPQTILPAARFPEAPIDVLMLESTLGADEEAESFTRREEERRLGEAIARVLGRGGSVLIPAFALGRAQEMLALVDRFKRRGMIPQGTPVYTTGQMRAVAELFDRTRHSSPRLDPEFEVFGVDQLRTPRNQANLRGTLGEGSIHIASSGMMFERTLSNALARMMIEDERHGVFFVGFCKEHSPGWRLQEAAATDEEVVLDVDEHPEPQTVRAEVERFRFSGHAHRRHLVDLVKRLRPREIILVHGETEAKQWLHDEIASRHPNIPIHVPGRSVELVLEAHSASS